MAKRGNVNNLKPLNTRTKEEQREIQSKAGKKSGESRQRKADFNEAARWALEMDTTVVMNGEALNVTQAQAIVLNLLRKARNIEDKQCIEAAKTLIGLSSARTVAEVRVLEANAKMLEAKADLLTGADTTTLDKLDSILKEMKAEAEKGGDE